MEKGRQFKNRFGWTCGEKRPLGNGVDSEIKMGKHNDRPLRDVRQSKRVSQPKKWFRGWEGGNKKNPNTKESVYRGRILNRGFSKGWRRPNAQNRAPIRGGFQTCKCKNTTKHAIWKERLSGMISIKYSKLCLKGRTIEMNWILQKKTKLIETPWWIFAIEEHSHLILTCQNVQSSQTKIQPFIPLQRLYI